MSNKKNLSEAAMEILNANRKTKDSDQDKFGQGEKLNDTANKPAQDIGNAGIEKYDVNAPSATPPGQTPPVGKEAPKKLPKQPAQTGIADTDVDQLPKKGVNEEGLTDEDDIVTEDIAALMAGENLSEDFKNKAIAIFEAAVTTKVAALAEELEAKYLAQFEESVEEMKTESELKIDKYLDYVVESWLEENKLAVESGLKSEIVEGFIGSLKQVFEEHYIDIPNEKFDVVEELASKVEALEKQVNEEIHKNIDLKQKLSEQKKIEALHSVCEGLTISQAEKIKSIAESVDYVSDDEFVKQMVDIKESYFSQASSVKPAPIESLNSDVFELNEDTKDKIDPTIAAYVAGISKTTFK